MSDTVDDYLRRVERNLQGDRSGARSILDELRSHIAEKVADMARRDPGRPRADLEREVLAGLGDPSEFALRFEGERPVLQRTSTGETVLRVTRAVGRGATRLVKGLLVAIFVLLLVGVALGVWAFHEVRPYVEGRIPSTVYEFHRDCDPPAGCDAGPTRSLFFVYDAANQVRFDLHMHPHGEFAAGSVRIEVRDPTGALLFNRTLDAASEGVVNEVGTWQPRVGDWTAVVEVRGFVGHLDLEIWTFGLPGT